MARSISRRELFASAAAGIAAPTALGTGATVAAQAPQRPASAGLPAVWGQDFLYQWSPPENLARDLTPGTSQLRLSAQVTAIEVQQIAGRMQISDPARPLRTLMLDGQPHMVHTDTGVQMATVVATVRGDTLTIATTQPFGGMPGNATLRITETWSLSPDGKTMAVRTERDLPALRQTFNEIFNRR